MVNEIFLLFTMTFISQQLPYLCAVLTLCHTADIRTRQKGSNRSLLP